MNPRHCQNKEFLISQTGKLGPYKERLAQVTQPGTGRVRDTVIHLRLWALTSPHPCPQRTLDLVIQHETACE